MTNHFDTRYMQRTDIYWLANSWLYELQSVDPVDDHIKARQLESPGLVVYAL